MLTSILSGYVYKRVKTREVELRGFDDAGCLFWTSELAFDVEVSDYPDGHPIRGVSDNRRCVDIVSLGQSFPSLSTGEK